MDKKILKILIAGLVLLIGIGAVSALESNSTDDVAVCDDDSIAIDDDASVEEADQESNEPLAIDDSDNNEPISTSDSSLLKANSTETQLTSNSTSDIKITPQYKTYKVGTLKLSKKYKKFMKMKKAPSKKNKKVWKEYKKFKKALKKASKKTTKSMVKKLKKLMKKHWILYGESMKKKTKGKYFYTTYYGKFYRVKYYDPVTKESWWKEDV